MERDTIANMSEAILQIRTRECSRADARPPSTSVYGDEDDDDQVPMDGEDASEQLTTISSQLQRDLAGETLNTL